eukprot:8719793-Alexandrium_andersonii.AAC.1
MSASLVGSEMCIRDSRTTVATRGSGVLGRGRAELGKVSPASPRRMLAAPEYSAAAVTTAGQQRRHRPPPLRRMLAAPGYSVAAVTTAGQPR